VSAVASDRISEHVVVGAQALVTVQRELNEIGVALVATDCSPCDTDTSCLESISKRRVNGQWKRDDVELVKLERNVHACYVVAHSVVLAHR
jgi:uncharacterized UPF0146 family protein